MAMSIWEYAKKKKTMEQDLKDTQSLVDSTKLANDKKRFQSYMDQTRKARNQDLTQGRKRGEEVFKDGALGRVDAARSGEVAGLLQRRMDESQGMSPEEMTAARNAGLETINRGAQTSTRNLRGELARSGIRGPALGKALAGVEKERGSQGVTAERDLFLKNMDLRRSGLDSYERTLSGARTDELGRETYNQGQTGKELAGRLSTELGYGALGAGERGAIMQRLVGEESAQAAKKAAENSGGKK